MYTNNCLYCEQAFENMKGKLYIKIKAPDEAVRLMHVNIADKNSLFSVSLAAGSVYIFDVSYEMELYIPLGLNSKLMPEFIKVKPDEFTHLQVEYDYYYYKNHPRVKRTRLKRIEHLTSKDLYSMD